MKYHIPIWEKCLKLSGVPSIRQILDIIEQMLLNVNYFLQAFHAATKGDLGLGFKRRKTLHM